MRYAKITFSLPQDLNKIVKAYCKKFCIGQGEFLRDLIRNKFYDQISTTPLRSVKSCSVCKLPKKEMIQDICLDCFDTLPVTEQQNFHPLQP